MNTKKAYLREKIAAQNRYTDIKLDVYSGDRKSINYYEHWGYKKVDGELFFPQTVLLL